MKSARFTFKLCINIFVTISVFVSIFAFLYSKNFSTDFINNSKAADTPFNPSFTKSFNFSSQHPSLPFPNSSWSNSSGVQKMGELDVTDANGRKSIYAIQNGYLNNVPNASGAYAYSPVLKYNYDANSWSQVLPDINLDHPGTDVLFFRRNIIIIGHIGCGTDIGANTPAYICNIVADNAGNLSIAQKIRVTETSQGGTWTSSIFPVGNEIYFTLQNNVDKRHFLKKFTLDTSNRVVMTNFNPTAGPSDADLVGDEGLRGIIRYCYSNDAGNLPDGTAFGARYQCSDTAANDINSFQYSSIIKSYDGDSTLWVLARNENRNQTRVVKVNMSDGRLVGSWDSFAQVDASNHFYLDSIKIQNRTYLVLFYRYQAINLPSCGMVAGVPVYTRTRLRIISTTSLLNLGSYTDAMSNCNDNIKTSFTYLPAYNDLIIGYAEKAGAGNNFYLKNDDPVNTNNWQNFSAGKDTPTNHDVHLETMFYSESNARLFASSLLGNWSEQPSIWTMNVYQKPEVDSFSVSCDTRLGSGHPYRLAFNIKTKSAFNNVNANYVLIVPKGTTGLNFQAGNPNLNSSVAQSINIANQSGIGVRHYDYTSQNWIATGSNFLLADNTPNNSPINNKPSSYSPSDKYSLESSTISFGANTNWDFFVEFNKNNSFYKSFLSPANTSATPGFDLYMLITDDTGNGNGPVTDKLASVDFDPFTECAGLFYKTSNGDYRTSESGAYNSQPLSDSYEVDYGRSGNKIWKNNSSDYKKYKAFANPDTPNSSIGNSMTFPDTSDFSFETSNSTSVPCDTKQGSSVSNSKGFCFQLATGSTGFRLDDAINFINSNKEKIEKNSQKLEINSTSSGAGGGWYSFDDTTPSDRKLNIYLDQLTSSDALQKNFYIEINNLTFGGNIYKVIINDSPDAAENVIVRCNVESCVMRIKNINSISASDNIIDSYNSGQKDVFDNIAKSKTRLYLNFGSSNDSYVPVNGSVTSPPVPANRKVVFETSELDKTNYFLGGVITSGFVYSTASSKTDIIKGFVLARGLSARGTNAGNRNLYFKDFPNPFVFIDYDPKFILKYAGIFSKPPQDVTRTYIGL